MKNPVEFPSVGINQLYKLPQYGGVYFAMQGGDVLYVGQSVNIRNRWIGHHKREQLSMFPDIRVHYVKSDGRSLYEQEAEWLNYCRPPLNSAGPRYYTQTAYEDLREIPPNLTYYIYVFTSIPSVIFAILNLLVFRNQEMFMAGAIVFFCSTTFLIGGWFTWWVAREVYKAKVVKHG